MHDGVEQLGVEVVGAALAGIWQTHAESEEVFLRHRLMAARTLKHRLPTVVLDHGRW